LVSATGCVATYCICAYSLKQVLRKKAGNKDTSTLLTTAACTHEQE